MCEICDIYNDKYGRGMVIAFAKNTQLKIHRDEYTNQLSIIAKGRGEAIYIPRYCPECGKKIRENGVE